MTDISIELKNVSKTFKIKKLNLATGKSTIEIINSLDNISLKIEKGKMIGIIGRNGSGKTTLLRVIAQIFYPQIGEVLVNGSVGPVLQIGAGGNDEFSVEETIIINGLYRGLKKQDILNKIPDILKFAELEVYRNTKMKHLSTGMKVRIMFSTIFSLDPDILLIDEVISVGDQEFRKKSFDSFISFKNRGKTILLVSHNLSMIQQLCDEVYYIDKGQIIDHGSPQKVIQSYTDSFKFTS